MDIILRNRKSNKFNLIFSIRNKLVFTYFFIILATLVLLSIYIYGTFKGYLYNQHQVRILTDANIVANVSNKTNNLSIESIMESVSAVHLDKNYRMIVIDSEAVVIYDSLYFSIMYSDLMNKTLINTELLTALRGKDSAEIKKDKLAGWVGTAAVPILSDKKVMGAVYIVSNIDSIREIIDAVSGQMFLISIAVSLLIGMASSMISGAVTAPILKLTDMVSSMTNGHLKQSFEINSRDEIAQFGKAFNTMSERLNEVEERRRIFVSDASHELKTPLSNMKLLADSLLQMEEMPQDNVKEFLGDISNEIDRLTRIIEHLLKLTKMDGKNISSSEFAKLSLMSIVNKAVNALRPMAKQKNVNIFLVGNVDLQFEVNSDMFWQAFYNIVDNAIKYTDIDGEIVVEVKEFEDSVEVQVSDNGIGIPKKDLEKIFERFYRVDKARARETGGTGLGLSISKEAIESIGGTIRMESEEGIGSVFHIILKKPDSNI